MFKRDQNHEGISPNPWADLALTIVYYAVRDALESAVGSRQFNEAVAFIKSGWCIDLLEIGESSVNIPMILNRIRKEKNDEQCV